MFLRLKKTKSSPVLQLVRSVWHKGSTPRQEIIASFGNAPVPVELFKEISACLEAYYEKLPSPKISNPESEVWCNKLLQLRKQTRTVNSENEREIPSLLDGVLLGEIEHGATAMLGPLLPLEKAWDELNIDDFLKENKFSQRNIDSIKICAYNRLLDPVSENGLPKWVDTTAFADLSGRIPNPDPSHYYRAGDKLYAIKDKLEKYLHQKELSHFSIKNTIWLYDLTNSYFEGQCKSNSKAKRTINSKEKRTDCPVIALGMVLNQEGFPICHRVFDGNSNDCKSIPQIIEDLRKLTSAGELDSTMKNSNTDQNNLQKRPTVVMDGGIATEKNLNLLIEAGYDYIVNGKRTTREQFYEDFIDEDKFHIVGNRNDKAPVFVSVQRNEKETILLCRSNARKQKEDAMVSKTEEHFLDAIKKLKGRVQRNDPRLKLKNGGRRVEQNIGAVKSKYTRAAKFYTVSYDEENKTILCIRDDDKYRREQDIHGCYHLRTNRSDLTDDEIWRTYITLTRIESSFRSMKSDLGLRPFYHQKDERCEAHVLFTVLAYHLQRFVELSLERAEIEATFPAVRRLLQTHCYATISVPSKNGQTVLIRKPGKVDKAQAMIYDALKIRTYSLPRKKQIITGNIGNIKKLL